MAGRTFLWVGGWSYDDDGTRIVSVHVAAASDDAGAKRPRGPSLYVDLVAKTPSLVETSAALPGDVHGIIGFALARGWKPDASRAPVFRILPADGLTLPSLEVVHHEALVKQWHGFARRSRRGARAAPTFSLLFPDSELGALLASALAVPALAGCADDAPAWRDDRHLIRSRHRADGGRLMSWTSAWARDFAALVGALRAARASAPDVGASLRGHPSVDMRVELLSVEAAPTSVAPPDGAETFPGWPGRQNQTWLVNAPEDPRLEAFTYDATGHLSAWTTLRPSGAHERRYR